MTVPWLERINNCHGALATAGRLPQSAGRDPFIVPGTTVRIEETYTGYLLTVRAESDDVTDDVVQRTVADDRSEGARNSRGIESLTR